MTALSEDTSTPVYVPLEDKIFTLFKTTPLFSFKDVRKAFPQPNDKTIYRALQKLESQNRIRFVSWHQKMKLFTAIGQSELPNITTIDGDTFPISVVLQHISELYKDGYWQSLRRVNNVPILLGTPFAIAQLEGAELIPQYKALIIKLADARHALTTLLGYVESLMDHPAMHGDPTYFKSVFNGEDSAMPSPAEITEFKRWVSNVYEKEKVDEE